MTPPDTPLDDPILAALEAAEEAGDPVDELELARLPRNDIGNAERLKARFGRDLLHVLSAGWYAWDGRRWAGPAAETGGEAAAMRLVHRTVEAIGTSEVAALREMARADEAKEAARKADKELEAARTALDDGTGGDMETKRARAGAAATAAALAAGAARRAEGPANAHRAWAIQSGNTAKVAGMLKQAQPYLAIQASAMDAAPFAINLEDGTLDLDRLAGPDGEDPPDLLRPFSRRDKATRMGRARWGGRPAAPLWSAFLERVLPDPDVREFAQRWFGYCLTGSTEEQALVVLYGTGGNGKSTLVNLIRRVMGDYAVSVPIETFLATGRKGKGGDATPDLVRLPGARLVIASEPDQGDRLSESLVKQITGGEMLSARALYGAQFEFTPQFKITISANHRPRISGQDEGIWRRMRLVPFEQVIPPEERRPGLERELAGEADGILAWLVEGCRQWRARGLDPPLSVMAATEEYRRDSDPLADFWAACIEPAPGRYVQGGQLFRVYEAWCRGSGVDAVTQTKFGRLLKDRRVRKETVGTVRYLDLAIRAEAPDPSGVAEPGRLA